VPARGRARGRQRRALPTRTLLRWSLLLVVGVVAFLYYRPLTTYFETRAAVEARAAEVRELEAVNARLQERLERSATLAALSREARRSNLVRPGERLFIVKGIAEWRQAQRTMLRDG
jgi:hypothetical protein